MIDKWLVTNMKRPAVTFVQAQPLIDRGTVLVLEQSIVLVHRCRLQFNTVQLINKIIIYAGCLFSLT